MPPLSSLLLQRDVATLRELDEALAHQATYGGDLVLNLLEVASVDEAQLLQALSAAEGLQPTEPGALAPPQPQALQAVPREFALRHELVPLRLADGTLELAVAQPPAPSVLDDLSVRSGLRLKLYITTCLRVHQALEAAYQQPMDRRMVRALARLEHLADVGEAVEAPSEAPHDPLSFASPLMYLPRRHRTAPLRPGSKRRGPFTLAMAQDALDAADHHSSILRVVFDFARQFFEYTALFLVRGDTAEGAEASGPGASRQRVRGIGVPLEIPSLLSRAREAGRYLLEAPTDDVLDAALRRDLQRPMRARVLVVPVMIRKRTVALLYGDEGASDVDLEHVGEVFALTHLVEAALERLILLRKLAAQRGSSKATGTPEPPKLRRQGSTLRGVPAAQTYEQAVSQPPVSQPVAAPFPDEASPRARTATWVPARPTSSTMPFFRPVKVPPAAAVPQEPFAQEASVDRAAPSHEQAEPSRMHPVTVAPVVPVGVQAPRQQPPTGPAVPAHHEQTPTWGTKVRPRDSDPQAGAIEQPIDPDSQAAQEQQDDALEQRPDVDVSSDDQATAKPPAGEPDAAPEQETTEPPADESEPNVADAAPVTDGPAEQVTAPSEVSLPIEQVAEQLEVTAHQTEPQPGDSSADEDAVGSERPVEVAAALAQPELQLSPEPEATPEPDIPVEFSPSVSEVTIEVSSEPAPTLVMGESDEQDEMLLAVIAEMDRSPTNSDVLLDELLEPAGEGPVAEGPREPPKCRAPSDFGLPLVIVDLRGEAEQLVARLDAGELPTHEAKRVRKTLARMGQPAVDAVAACFPGRVSVDIATISLQDLPPVSECGAVLELAVALGAPIVTHMEALSRGPDVAKRFWSVRVLGEIGGSEAADALRRALFDEDEIVQRAARSVVRMPSGRAVWVATRELVYRVAEDDTEPARRRIAALETLELVREPSSVPVLCAALEATSQAVREVGYRVLRNVTKRSIAPDAEQWALWWEANRRRARAQWLIDAIALEDDEDLRESAANELRPHVGKDFGFARGQSRQDRIKVQDKLLAWWQHSR